MYITLRSRFSKPSFLFTTMSLMAAFVVAISLWLMVPTARAAVEPSVVVNNPVISYGVALNISGTGFTPSERISLWVTSPDQVATDFGYVYADNTGSLTAVTLGQTLTGGLPGRWAISLEGMQSKVVAIGNFDLLEPTLRAGGLATSSTTAVVVYNGDYFAPGERVSLWITDATGTVLDVGMTYAGKDGSIPAGSQEGFNFAGSAGNYKITAYGNTSRQTAVTTLNVSAF